MNHEFLEAQIKEAKDCIKYYTRKSGSSKSHDARRRVRHRLRKTSNTTL